MCQESAEKNRDRLEKDIFLKINFILSFLSHHLSHLSAGIPGSPKAGVRIYMLPKSSNESVS